MKKKMKRAGGIFLDALMQMVFYVVGFIMRLLYLGRVEYTDPSAKEAMRKGAVLIANHVSHKDGFFVPIMLPFQKVYVLVTSKWYNKRFLKPLFSHLRYIPIDLQRQDRDWMVKAEAMLKKGRNVMIFPEGELEKDGVPKPFHSGFLLPVKHLDAPVIPMAIVGDYKLLHRQKLVIGSPINLDFSSKGRLSVILKEASEQCSKEVFALKESKSH